jgi:hypothetical protein
MSRSFDGVAEAPESAPLEWVWTPRDTFVPLDDEGATSAAAPGPALLRAQWELARRGLRRGVWCCTVGGRLLVHDADEERALALVDVAVALGWTCVDRNTAEVTHPLALGDERAIGHALSPPGGGLRAPARHAAPAPHERSLMPSRTQWGQGAASVIDVFGLSSRSCRRRSS